MSAACTTTGWADVAMGLGLLFIFCAFMGFLIWMAGR